MNWVIAASIVLVAAVVIGLVYYYIVGPSERAAGSDELRKEQQAKADGLQAGSAAVRKVVDDAGKVIDKQAAEKKALSPVEVANAEIERRLKTLGKKP